MTNQPVTGTTPPSKSKLKELLLVLAILACVFLLIPRLASMLKGNSHHASGSQDAEQQLSDCMAESVGKPTDAQAACYETALARWNDRLVNDRVAAERSLGSQTSKKEEFDKSVELMQQDIDRFAKHALSTKETKRLVVAATKYNGYQASVLQLEGLLKKGTVPKWENGNFVK